MGISVYRPSQQAVGSFDGGKITEQKPIGFSGEGSGVKRIGPLFYWAWAQAAQEGYIPLHPHQAFEIITYVVHGQAEHGDTLGTKSVVGAGGLQVMQTGSGVSHEERFIGPDMEAFQIWFEPFIQEAMKRKPTYHQFESTDFPVIEQDGVRIKNIIGSGSPVLLTTDVQMWDVQLSSSSTYEHLVPEGYVLATLALRGTGSWKEDDWTYFQERDFIVLEADEQRIYQLKTDSELRMIFIQVPSKTDYKLYPKW
ncbi:pirin family protein [Shimazuella sp. AN120528]|nr:pirin family protein [Shimazuella soli]MCH5585775.1 pirin family protein [Shimazuella soli]